MVRIDQQLQRAAKQFERRFDRRPRFAAVAPGRVNIIGEHTDYNEGFVLPMAIELQTLIVADTSNGSTAQIASVDPKTGTLWRVAFEVNPNLGPGPPSWSNYVRGVVAGCLRAGLDPGGFDALIDSTVPVGGGLSSSAALELATATLIESITHRSLDPIDKAILCQKAEHEFAGMPCGIMDQFISVIGREGHAVLLDCRTHETRLVPMTDPNVTLLIINSNVKHELSGGEYARRRQQCERAAAALGAGSLRDVSMRQLVESRSWLDPLICRRAMHVVGENARTQQAADEISRGVWASVGRLMHKSHKSLRDDFEVSCDELDLLVELAQQKVTKTGGAFGSRMTGGGFGGCTVTLVRTDKLEQILQHITSHYERQTGIRATALATRPAAGARIIEMP